MKPPPAELPARAAAASLPELLARFLESLTIRGLSPATVKAYRLTLSRFLRFLETQAGFEENRAQATDLSREHIGAFLTAVRYPPGRSSLTPNTLAMYDKILRGFTAWLARAGHLLFDPAGRLPRFPTPAPALPWVPSEEQVAALLAACSVETPIGIWTRTLVELLYGSALRLGEALALTLSDCDMEAGQLLIRSGKGDKDRRVPMSDGARVWLFRYLERARPLFLWKARPTTALFLASTTGRPLGILMARLSFHEARKKAGLPLPFVPHGLRHAAASHMLAQEQSDGGCDLAYIRELLGHARLATTERYTQVRIDDLVEAPPGAPQGQRCFHAAWRRMGKPRS